MMKLLVFESFLAGMGGPISKLPPSLVREAKAMLGILLESLALDPTKEVRVLIDPEAEVRVPDSIHATWSTSHPLVDFLGLLCRCDTFWPIAPETDGMLQNLAKKARNYGVLTLVPEAPFLAMATDKWLTHQHLKAHGLPNPKTTLPGDPVEGPGPWVVKPRDGVGSQDIHLVHTREALPNRGNWIIQPFSKGQPISQSLVGGPLGVWHLPPCSQILESPGSFEYKGGIVPLSDAYTERATALTRRLVATLDRFYGWVGIDMILGLDPSGSEDQIIEINPRLTTSFAGLTRLTREPLAPKIVDHAVGRPTEQPTFAQGPLRFHADGTVEPINRV